MCCVTFMPFPPQDFPWIVADEQEVHMQEPRLIPLKTMTSDIVKVSQICEETDTKIKSRLPLYHICDFLFDADAAVCGRESPEDVGPHFADRPGCYWAVRTSVTVLGHKQSV